MTRPRFILCALLFSSVASAEPLQFSAGVWDYEIRGVEVDRGVQRDLKDDLAVRESGGLSLALAWDIDHGWWPDLAATYSEFGGDGSVPVQGGGLFGGGGRIESHGEFTDADLVLRWPFEFGSVRFSPGLAFKRLEGEFTVDDPMQTGLTRQVVDEVFPQAHGELRWSGGRWSASGVVQAISDGEQKANEFRLVAGLRLWGPLLLQAGWQQKRYDIRQNGFELRARLSGPVLRAGFTF